jgi:hypothetical protein
MVQIGLRIDEKLRRRIDAQLKREGLDHFGGLKHLLVDMLEAELARRERAYKKRKGGG